MKNLSNKMLTLLMVVVLGVGFAAFVGWLRSRRENSLTALETSAAAVDRL